MNKVVEYISEGSKYTQKNNEKRYRECWKDLQISSSVYREGFLKKATLEQRPEGGEGAIWVSNTRAFPGIYKDYFLNLF